MKGQDLLWLFVIEKREVGLFQAGDWRSGLVGHGYVERDATIRVARRDRRRRPGPPPWSTLLCKSSHERKSD
jgi:hypothetical protein